jgi:hypothetical protein
MASLEESGEPTFDFVSSATNVGFDSMTTSLTGSSGFFDSTLIAAAAAVSMQLVQREFPPLAKSHA